jgi:hypothetical protein
MLKFIDGLIKKTGVMLLAISLFLIILFVIVLVFFTLRLFAQVTLSPIGDAIVSFAMMSVPVSVLLSAAIVFLLRTKHYHSKPIKMFSYIVLLVVIGVAIYAYINDVTVYFKKAVPDFEIGAFISYDKWFSVFCIGAMFFLGIIQALKMPKEDDWITKHNKRNSVS